MSLKQNAFEYMKQKALADKSKALTSLDLLLEHPAGIGDHSTEDFYKNLDEALDTLVDADDRIEKLEELKVVYSIHTRAEQGLSPPAPF